MARVNWQGDQLKQRVVAAVSEAVEVTGERLQETAQRINRERAYDTGAMTAGWTKGPLQVSASRIGIQVSNDVFYAIFVDKGTSRMAPRNISASAMDEVAPTLPREIASRL